MHIRRGGRGFGIYKIILEGARAIDLAPAAGEAGILIREVTAFLVHFIEEDVQGDAVFGPENIQKQAEIPAAAGSIVVEEDLPRFVLEWLVDMPGDGGLINALQFLQQGPGAGIVKGRAWRGSWGSAARNFLRRQSGGGDGN